MCGHTHTVVLSGNYYYNLACNVDAFFQAVQNILLYFFLSVDDVRTDLDHAKKEKRHQQTLKMSMPSPESSTNSKRDDRRKDGKCRMPTSPEEKKLVTDQITEQLLSNGLKSQACVLL